MTGRHSTLGALLDEPRNGFNAARLVAAALVVVSHSFLLVHGSEAAEPLAAGPYDLGASAVNVFFVLSGLMLSRSYELKPDWRAFAAARLLRIFPALLAAGIVVGWMLAPFTADRPLADYFADPETLIYPFASLFMFENAHLSGVFLASPRPGEIDLPLWTVKYELFAYLAFGLVSALGLLRSRLVVLLLLIGFAVALTATSNLGVLDNHPAGSMLRFGFCFFVGVAAWRWRARIVISLPMVLSAILPALLLWATPLGPVTSIVGWAAAALLLAATPVPGLTGFAGTLDISFGLYIYAWPIQQMVLGVPWAGGNVTIHLAVSLAAASILAILSALVVERPALRLKSRFGRKGPARPPSLTGARPRA